MNQTMGALLGLLITLMVPAYFVLQPLALFRMSGKWRIAAAAPLARAIPAAADCLYALAQDSNLWPLIFIFFAPIGTLYLGILLAFHAGS
jgi:hypothetical protein